MLGASLLSRCRQAASSFASSSSTLISGIRLRQFPHSSPSTLQIRTSTKKGGGSAKNNRKTAGKRLGVKLFQDQYILPGQIIVRQRGLKFHPGQHVLSGRDHTLFATQPGYLKFYMSPLAFPHMERSGLQDEKNGLRVRWSPDGLPIRPKKEWPDVKRPRGMKRYIGVAKEKGEVLPRDMRREGRDRRFWGWPTEELEGEMRGPSSGIDVEAGMKATI